MPTAPPAPPHRRAARSLYGTLLQLWRVLPLPRWLRGAILWVGNERYPIGVVGVIWDAEGRLLLARHTYKPGSGWGLPGGWLRGRESLPVGLARELAEELGFRVTVGDLVGWGEMRTPRHFTLGFACQLQDGAFRPNAEISEIAYFPVEEAVRLVTPRLRPLIEMAARARDRSTQAAEGATQGADA